MIKLKEIEEYLIQEGFENINDEDFPVYNSNFITIHPDPNNDGCGSELPIKSICFSASENGWYEINSPTLEQIKNLIQLYKSAEFHGNVSYTHARMYTNIIFKKFHQFLKDDNLIISDDA